MTSNSAALASGSNATSTIPTTHSHGNPQTQMHGSNTTHALVSPSSGSSMPSPSPFATFSSLAALSKDPILKREKIFDHFIASLNTYPGSFQSKMARIEELDKECSAQSEHLHSMANHHIQALKSSRLAAGLPHAHSEPTAHGDATTCEPDSAMDLSGNTETKEPENPMMVKFGFNENYDIESGEKYLKEISEELAKKTHSKSLIANEIYDAFDIHMRKMDSILKKYEGKIRKGFTEIPSTAIDLRNGSKIVMDPETRNLAFSLEHELKKDMERHRANESGDLMSGDASRKGSSSEPVYCICRQISYGAMVACDEENCAMEWFHFACVGLETKPRRKWYCPQCTEKRKRKRIKLAMEEKEKSKRG